MMPWEAAQTGESLGRASRRSWVHLGGLRFWALCLRLWVLGFRVFGFLNASFRGCGLWIFTGFLVESGFGDAEAVVLFCFRGVGRD